MSEENLLNNIIKYFPSEIVSPSYNYLYDLGIMPTISTLFTAVRKSNYNLVKIILDDPISQEWNLNQRLPKEDNFTLAEIASENIVNNSESYYIDILELLLKRGLDPNHTLSHNEDHNEDHNGDYNGVKILSTFISLTSSKNELIMPFDNSIWISIDLLVKYGLNFTKKVYDNKTLFQYWIETFFRNKISLNIDEINDFFKLLNVIIKSGQKFEFCKITEELVKSIPNDIKNDSRWYPHLLRLFQKYQIVVINHNISNDNYLCKICHKNNRTKLFIPCNHLATCDDCYNKIKKDKICPVCSRISSEVIDVYLP